MAPGIIIHHEAHQKTGPLITIGDHGLKDKTYGLPDEATDYNTRPWTTRRDHGLSNGHSLNMRGYREILQASPGALVFEPANQYMTTARTPVFYLLVQTPGTRLYS